MSRLSLSTLNPEVDNIEEYLKGLCSSEFNQLLKIADIEASLISDYNLINLTTLSINIFCSEMKIDQESIISDHKMINIIIQRFLSTVVIFSLMKKGILEKTSLEPLSLYKDFSFKNILNK